VHAAAMEGAGTAGMIDRFGRRIDYVRLSVTDRCDLRCRYCMPRQMRFRPRDALMSASEILRLGEILVERGVRRIRVTGGEPLVRREIGAVVAGLGALLGRGLEELTLTTNGTQLSRCAALLHDAGVRRVNVSLDTLRPERFLERGYTPFEYLPFGGGARRCLGAAFALYEMKLVLASILRKYDLRPASDAPVRVSVRNTTVGPRGEVELLFA